MKLRATITRLRAALAESMEWGWSSDPPPPEVLARREAALGIRRAYAVFQSLQGIMGSAVSCGYGGVGGVIGLHSRAPRKILIVVRSQCST